MRILARRVELPLNVAVDGAMDTHFREQHWPPVLSSVDQHLNSQPSFRCITFCFGELLDVVGGVAERPRRRSTRQGDGLIERAFPGHNATPQRHRDSNRRAGIRSGLAPIPPRIFRRVPCRVLPPFLEVGICALWKILSPPYFEGGACGLKTRRGAMSIVAKAYRNRSNR